jgi:tetratricopeptide (TPR) repeat protein
MMAPLAAETEVPVVDDRDDRTRDVSATNAVGLVEDVLELVATEAAVLLDGDAAAKERLADLNVRTALASWDVLERPDAALRVLELADGHPLAERLRLQAAIATTELGELTKPMAADVTVDAAEVLLWRQGEPARAAVLAERVLARPDRSPAARDAAVELAAIAHAAAGAWDRVVALRRGNLDATAPLARVAATAALVADRAHDAAAALDACVAALERAGDGDALARLRVLDVGADAAARLGDRRRARLLEQRAELVASLPGGLLDALATRHAHAAELARTGDGTAASARFAALADDPANQLGRAASRVALVAAVHAAAAAGDARAQLALHRRLADSECSEVAATHAWRALELAAALGEPTRDLVRAVAELDATAGALVELEARELLEPSPDAVARLAARGGRFTRAAALAAERIGDRKRARELWRAAPGGAEHLARLVRGEDDDELAALYLAATDAEPDARGRAAMWCARGIVELARGDATAAEDALRRAATLDPADACSRAALVSLLRAHGRTELLAGALADLAAALTSRDARASASRERAVVLAGLGDPAAARELLERSVAERPDDDVALLALADALDREAAADSAAAAIAAAATMPEPAAEIAAAPATADPASPAARSNPGIPAMPAIPAPPAHPPGSPRSAATTTGAVRIIEATVPDAARAKLDHAIELRLRAVNHAPPNRRADIWLAIARAQDRRGDTAAALAALDRAADLANNLDPGVTASTGDRTTALAIQREQIRLLRRTGRDDRALAAVRAALALEPVTARRVELQRDLAEVLTALDRDPADIVAAYLDVLSHEPDQTDALAGIEAPARALKLWDELARAFRGAPATPHNLDVLAEALVHIAEWSELAEVRRRQLDLATVPVERARIASELATLYARELGDADAAVRMLALAQSLDHSPLRFRELARTLRDAQRFSELAVALERELAAIPVAQVDAQVAVLHELAELLLTKLARPADAVVAYEAIVARRPDDAAAVIALEHLYAELGREQELVAIMESRAEAATDPLARSALFAKVAAQRAKRGEVDAAIAAYGAAFRANPDSRDVFTQMERVCYKSERWAEAMDLYGIAIAHVEQHSSRAYRLGDLYARRGNVQRAYLGDVDAAILSYQKVVEVDSQPTTAAQSLDEICAARADWMPLIVAWERRADHQKDPQRRTDALRAAAQLATDHAVGDHKLGIRLQKKLLALDPLDSDAAAALERYYESHADPSGLVDVLKTRLAAAVTPDDTVALLRKIARTSEDGGRDVETATEHYRKILEIQKDNREALESLARIFESTEQWAEYVEVTRDLIKVTTDRPTKALLFFRCGSVMEAKFGRESDAIRYYHHAIKTSPHCMPAVHGLRDLYRRREEWGRVIETLELEVKLWTDDKERAGVLAQIGRIHDKQLGDAARALGYYEQALAADPECLPANQAMFEVAFERGDWPAALPLGRALARPMEREGDPSSRSEFFRRLGVVAARSGDYRFAADSLRAALEQRPTHTAALDELGAIARAQPDAYDFATIYQALEKDYRKRDDTNPLLARVLIARAHTAERDGDLDQAAALYAGAVELAPADLGVVMARVELDVATRAWPTAIAALERFADTDGVTVEDRVVARMRLAQIHADGELDAARAIAVLEDVIRIEPAHQEAHYLLAQELVVVGRLDDARAAIDRVIELASAPGQPLSPESLARYYYYKGHILERLGDARASAQYRRAIDHDPGYAPPAIVLAQRAAAGGDVRGAESILIETAHAAIAAGGTTAAVPLQRGLARILLAHGERAAAIEAYRGILAVEPDGVADRLALADIYASDDPPRAITELRRVVERDVHQAIAYRALAELYERTNAPVRAARVLLALELLGYASDADREQLAAARASLPPQPPPRRLIDPHSAPPFGGAARSGRAGPIDPDTRARLLVAPAAHDALGEVFAALADDITASITPPPPGEALQPLAVVDPRAAQIAGELASLFQTETELFAAEHVPGLAMATAYPRRTLVIDRTLLGASERALRFVLGYHLDAIRGGYAILLQLGAKQRRDLVQLLRGLVGPATERAGAAEELADRASPRARKVIDRLANTVEPDAAAWIDGMLATAKRAGLVACDDLAAAAATIVELSGEQLPGADLIRFYVGDGYAQLRDLLAL